MSYPYGAGSARARTGWFFGLTGFQITAVFVGGFPVWLAAAVGSWFSLLVWLPVWGAVVGLVCVPVRGWSTAQWLIVMARHALGRATGWTRWQSARASEGAAADAGDDDVGGVAELPDLPGVLTSVQVHDGPPLLTSGNAASTGVTRVAIVQNHAMRTWAAVARVEHPGLGLLASEDRDRMGAGLAELCENASQGELIDLLTITVRTVPEDGAARADWVARHHQDQAPELATQVNQLLSEVLMPASVRREVFVTVVVREERISRDARRAGGGVVGRSRVLYGLLGEVETRLTGAIGCTSVSWLDSAALAAVVRTGFEPGDAPAIAAAEIAGGDGAKVTHRVPWSAAGPANAWTAMRSYRHGDWESVSSSLVLPAQGAVMGALAPVLVPTQAGERRALTVFYRPVPRRAADRTTGRDEVSAAMASEMRRRAGMVERSRQRQAAQNVHATDAKLARGRSLVQVAAVASVTFPASWNSLDLGRTLDSSIRVSGFAPLPLDGAHDAAFVAATLPLGTGIPAARGRRAAR